MLGVTGGLKEKLVNPIREVTMAKFTDAPEVEMIARSLLVSEHSELLEAKIRYLFREGDWSTRDKETLGQAQLLTGKQHFITKLDFVITINKDAWTVLTNNQRIALVDHELSHCCRGEDDKFGNPTWYIQGHDVEDFIGVINRHGYWTPTLRRFDEAGQKYRQLTIQELQPTGTDDD